MLFSRATNQGSTSWSPAWLSDPSSTYRLCGHSLLGLPLGFRLCHAARFQGPISGSPTSSSLAPQSPLCSSHLCWALLTLSPGTPHCSSHPSPQSLYHTPFLLLSLAFPSAQPSPLALPSPVYTPLSPFYCRFFPWEEGVWEEGAGNEQRERTFSLWLTERENRKAERVRK